jgi:hypothetical protein
MDTYTVEIKVTEARYAIIEVEAENIGKAYEKTHKLIPDQDYELEDADDFDVTVLSLKHTE